MKKRVFMMLVLAMVTVAAITGCGNRENNNTGTNSMQPTNGTNENTTGERDSQTNENDGMNSTSRDNNGTNSVSTDNNASIDNNNRSSNGVVGDVLTDAANGVENIGNDIESAVDGTNTSETVATDTQRSSGY